MCCKCILLLNRKENPKPTEDGIVNRPELDLAADLLAARNMLPRRNPSIVC